MIYRSYGILVPANIYLKYLVHFNFIYAHLTISGKGGKRKEIWSLEATKMLVILVKDNFSRLTDKRTKRALVWRDITSSLKAIVSVYVLILKMF